MIGSIYQGKKSDFGHQYTNRLKKGTNALTTLQHIN